MTAEPGEGLYAAFVEVCNDSDRPQPATGQIVLAIRPRGGGEPARVELDR